MSRGLQVIIAIGVVLVVAALVFATLGPLLLPQLRVALPAGGPAFRNRPEGGPIVPIRQGRPFGPRMPFFGFLGLARLAWPVLIVALIALALFALLRRPAVVMPAPLPAVPAVPANLTTCSQCGQPLAAGWKHCPNCGKPTTA